LPWFNVHARRPAERLYRVKTGNTAYAHGNTCVVKSYADVIEEYRMHPESKLAGLDSVPCREETVGLLKRRRIFIDSVTHIGKETHELEEREVGLHHDLRLVQEEFGDPAIDNDAMLRQRVRSPARVGLDRTAHVHRTTLWWFATGRTKLSTRVAMRVRRALLNNPAGSTKAGLHESDGAFD
jgi:hypothetical protein